MSNSDPVRPAWKFRWPAIAAATGILAAVTAVALHFVWHRSSPALMESADGYKRIGYGEIVRSHGRAGTVLALEDGSLIEMRAQSSSLWNAPAMACGSA